MEKAKEFSVVLRQGIINYHSSENSYSTISNRLALPRSTVQSVIKKLKQFGTTGNLPGRGRKSKLSPRTERKLCCEVNIKPSVVLKDFAKSFDTMSISVSSRTIQRSLNRNGSYGN